MWVERKFNLPKLFSNFTAKYSRVILLSSLGIFIFSAYGILKLKVENSFIDYFKSSTEINKGMKVKDQVEDDCAICLEKLSCTLEPQ